MIGSAIGEQSSKGPTNAGVGGKMNVSLNSLMALSQEDEDSILGDMYWDKMMSDFGLGRDHDGDSVSGSEADKVPSSWESVDSTLSWAAPIQSTLHNSVNIFQKN